MGQRTRFLPPRHLSFDAAALQPADAAASAGVNSLVFDGLDLQLGLSGEAPQRDARWRYIEQALLAPSRRRIALYLDWVLLGSGATLSRLRISCEGRSQSRELQTRHQPAGADGSLPLVQRGERLRLLLPRSTRPRRRLGILLEIEAETLETGAQAQAVLNTLDIVAL